MRYRHLCAHEQMGATIVSVMNNAGAHPLGTIAIYKRRALPALRRRAAGV